MRIAVAAAMFCLQNLASVCAAGETTLTVNSRTLSEEAFLRGDRTAGESVTLSGALALPEKPGRFPVVILLHGSDGPGSGAAWAWERYLGGLGVATFRLDSFTGRGLTQISADQQAFGQFTQIYDAYRAIETVAAHPRIDPDRIALMGFSRGGIATLYSAMIRFQSAFGPKQGRIVARLPFYPACNFELNGELEISDAPIREFHGALDDWTPAGPCQDYIGRLAAAGHDAEMVIYEGALHAFDSPRNPARFTDSDVQTSRACWRKEADFQLVNAETGRPFSYDDRCVEYGPSSQYNDKAATAAQAAVKPFLEKVFSQK